MSCLCFPYGSYSSLTGARGVRPVLQPGSPGRSRAGPVGWWWQHRSRFPLWPSPTRQAVGRECVPLGLTEAEWSGFFLVRCLHQASRLIPVFASAQTVKNFRPSLTQAPFYPLIQKQSAASHRQPLMFTITFSIFAMHMNTHVSVKNQ